MKPLLALLLLFPLAQDDKAAEELFKAMCEKIEKAKTLRVEWTTTLNQGGGSVPFLKGSAKVKGKDRWVIEYSYCRSASSYGNDLHLMCDGRRVLTLKQPRLAFTELLKPEEVTEVIRRSLGASMLIRFGQEIAEIEEEVREAPVTGAFKGGGKEKVAGSEADVIAYTLAYAGNWLQGQTAKAKVFVRSSDKSLLKREVSIPGIQWIDTFQAFVLDEDLPDSDFCFQSRRRLARARTRQLARSVELFGTFTGRHPLSLQDLAKRPSYLESDVFWPEGGFLLGGAVLKDPWGGAFELREKDGRVSVACLGADGKPGGRGDDEDAVVELPAATRQAVGAPTERLQRHYTARVQIHLLAGAVRGFRDAYAELPKKKAALWEKSEEIEVWPDGGWLQGGKVPIDPWGEPFRIISDAHVVRVQVNDPKARLLTISQLTPEEAKKLEEVAKPRLSPDEEKEWRRLLGALGDDDLEVREKAQNKLKNFGAAIVPLIEERLKTEKDAEVALRLAAVRKGIPNRRPAWSREMASLSVTIERGAAEEGDAASNERLAAGSLKTFASAEVDFCRNDRDGNRVNDFWTADVAGLYTLSSTPDGKGAPLKLIDISVAAADASPIEDGALEGQYAGIEKYMERAPKAGYWFRALKKDMSEPGGPVEYEQDTDGKSGKVHNSCKFGFSAYPEEYGLTGTKTFIINENNTIFWKDTGGEAVLEWPSDADLGREWRKLD